MNETKFDWSDLNLFLAVARGGGLAAGASISGISAPTLGRHMVDLEQALGEVLFERLPRGYVLTKAGQNLLIEAEAVEQKVQNILRRRDNHLARLPVQITGGTWVTRFMAQNIAQLATDDVRLVFEASEQLLNIGRREATIALRNIRPDEPSVAARKTVKVAFAPYASSNADRDIWIAGTGQTPSANWVRTHKSKQIRIEASSVRSLLDLAKAGAGQVVLPCFVGDREHALTRTGPIITSLSHDQWLAVHGEDRNQPAVRATVDRIVKLFVANRALFSGET